MIGAAGDEHAQHVARALTSRGVRVLSVDTTETSSLTWNDGRVSFGGESLDELRVFYVKSIHLGLPLPERQLLEARDGTWPARYAAERERHSHVTSVLRSLEPGRLFVNPISRFDIHFMKLEQLAFLHRRGIRVPRSLSTSDAKAVRDFAKRHKQVIYKPLAGGALTRALTKNDLTADRLALLQTAPVLFQERIQGEEFRAYVLDGEPVAAFQIPTEGVVDARENLHKAKRAKPPPELWKPCIKAVRELGLIFAAVDVRRTRQGEVVILEVNPTPAISFFDDPKKGEVINRLAGFLKANA